MGYLRCVKRAEDVDISRYYCSRGCLARPRSDGVEPRALPAVPSSGQRQGRQPCMTRPPPTLRAWPVMYSKRGGSADATARAGNYCYLSLELLPTLPYCSGPPSISPTCVWRRGPRPHHAANRAPGVAGTKRGPYSGATVRVSDIIETAPSRMKFARLGTK